LILGIYEGKDLRYVGEVGSGINTKMRAELRADLDAHRLDKPPVVNPPRLRTAVWSKPRLVVRVEFSEWTDDDYLRQAAFKGMDIGKDPRKVVRETAISSDDAVEEAEARARKPVRRRKTAGSRADPFLEDPDNREDPPQAATPDEIAALEAMTKDGVWQVGGHDVSLSNLDKVLFPEHGFTKRDLIRYYVTISPILLPYFKNRPLNLSRWPDGVTGHTFWQKQVPSYTPKWISRWDYPEAGSSESHTYFVADRVATMAWLANHATIDIHPWTSTTDNYRSPTYALIDIDPGSKTTWEEVLTLARLFHAALEHLKVKAWPKVTGKRGIQIWVPVKQIYTYPETSAWVEAVSRAVGAAVPDLVSWEWAKTSRSGKARLDFTQNAVNKTLVAPYAVRPVADAAVSAPIEWDELDDPDIRPDRWNIKSVIERVRERGDLFRPVLETSQELPSVD
jgi:bifunctional non-homologous end joining protein LigD